MNIFTKIKNFFNSPEDTNALDTHNDRALSLWVSKALVSSGELKKFFILVNIFINT